MSTSTPPPPGGVGRKKAAASAAPATPGVVGTVAGEAVEELTEIGVRGFLEKHPEKFQKVLTALGFSPEIATKFGGILLGEFVRFLILRIAEKTGTKSVAVSAIANTIDDVIKGGVEAFAERARVITKGGHTAPADAHAGATPAAAAHTAPVAAPKSVVKRTQVGLAFIAALGRSVPVEVADEADEILRAETELTERMGREWYVDVMGKVPVYDAEGNLSEADELALRPHRVLTDQRRLETIQALFATGAGKRSPLTNLKALYDTLTGQKVDAEKKAEATKAEGDIASAEAELATTKANVKAFEDARSALLSAKSNLTKAQGSGDLVAIAAARKAHTAVKATYDLLAPGSARLYVELDAARAAKGKAENKAESAKAALKPKPEPKPSHWLRNTLIGTGVVLALVVLIAVIASVGVIIRDVGKSLELPPAAAPAAERK